MNWVMRRLCSVLTTLPIGPSHPGRTAGPGLEIARPDYFVLPHREPAWKIISERLGVLTEACAALAQSRSGRAERTRRAPSLHGGRHPRAPGRARRSLRPTLAKTARTAATLHPRLPQSRRKHELPRHDRLPVLRAFGKAGGCEARWRRCARRRPLRSRPWPSRGGPVSWTDRGCLPRPVTSKRGGERVSRAGRRAWRTDCSSEVPSSTKETASTA